MKKILLPLFAFAIAFTGCNKKEDDASVSFEKAAYTMKDSAISVKIISNYEGSSADLPFTLGGDAVEGEDFTISAKKFVIGGSSKVLEVTISPKDNYDSDKTLTLTLGTMPEGVIAGDRASASVTIEPRSKSGISFLERNIFMSAGVTIEVQIFDSEGGKFTATEDMVIPIKVKTDANNTAVENEHFKFTGSSDLVIAKGKSSGTIKLECLKVEVDKDVFYLTFDLGNKYTAGQFDNIRVTILGSYGDKINGEWVLYKEITDKAYFDEFWFGMLTTTNLGSASATDKIIIEDGEFKTEMTSFYGNYFGVVSDMRLGEEYILTVGMGDKRTLQLLNLNNINRYFSATQTSTDDVALLGVRVLAESETDAGADVLDVWIIDYEAKDFFPEFYDWGIYSDIKPVATVSGAPFNIQYKKVSE